MATGGWGQGCGNPLSLRETAWLLYPWARRRIAVPTGGRHEITLPLDFPHGEGVL